MLGVLPGQNGCEIRETGTETMKSIKLCHKVTELKTGLLTRHFRGSVLCGREELLLVQTLTFFKFQNQASTEGKEKKKEKA